MTENTDTLYIDLIDAETVAYFEDLENRSKENRR